MDGSANMERASETLIEGWGRNRSELGSGEMNGTDNDVLGLQRPHPGRMSSHHRDLAFRVQTGLSIEPPLAGSGGRKTWGSSVSSACAGVAEENGVRCPSHPLVVRLLQGSWAMPYLIYPDLVCIRGPLCPPGLVAHNAGMATTKKAVDGPDKC